MHKSWTEFLTDRIQAKEPRTPWKLMNKAHWYKWCAEHDFPTVSVLRSFERPDQIDLAGLPNSFVLKPTSESAMKGVMVLSVNEDGTYHDAMKDRILTHEEIVVEQQEVLRKAEGEHRALIVEEKVTDIEPGVFIPRDYKAYAFNGHIELITMIDRGSKPYTINWYDGSFNPITDERIKNNTWYVKVGKSEPPAEAQEIIELTRKASLALNTPFARIDLYNTVDGPILGELTLTPGGLYYGVTYSLSESQNYRMGLLWSRAEEDLEFQRKQTQNSLRAADRVIRPLEQDLLLHELQVILELDGKITLSDYQRSVKNARDRAKSFLENK